MEKMKAQRLYQPFRLQYEDVDLPVPGPNEVRVKTAYCGICGTDEEFYYGTSAFWEKGLIHTPMTQGHEASGIVDAVGENVTDIRPGDRVVIDCIVTCGKCEACRYGRRAECKDTRCVGTINSIDGAMAEYVVMPEKGIFKLPDNVSLKLGALVEPLSITLHAVERAKIQIGDIVLITGSGTIGLGAIPFCKLRGARKVIVMGRQPYKLEIAKKLGADIVVDTGREELDSIVVQETGGKGVNAVIEATGAGEVLNQAIKLCAYGARISSPSFYSEDYRDFPLNELALRNITYEAVWSNIDTYPRVLSVLEMGRFDFESMITHFYPLERYKEALEDIHEKRIPCLKCMIEFPVEGNQGHQTGK